MDAKSAKQASQQRISRKIEVLRHEDIPERQSIAMAISMERRHRLGPNGEYYRVPKRRGGSR